MSNWPGFYTELFHSLNEARQCMTPYAQLSSYIQQISQRQSDLITFSNQIIGHQRALTAAFQPAAMHIFDLERALAPYREFAEHIHKTEEAIRTAFVPHTQLLSKLAAAASESLACISFSHQRLCESLESVSLDAVSALASARVLRPLVVHAEFIDKTARRIAESTSDSDTHAFESALRLTGSQLLTTADALAELIPDVALEEVDHFEANQDLPRDLLDELLAGDDIEVAKTDSGLLIVGPSARIAQTAKLIQDLIINVNKAAQLAGLEEVFKITTKALQAFRDLPWCRSTCEKELGNLVDALYFLLYEGAGTDNLRYLCSNGGVMSDAECSPIWTIKLLRNKWLRHDIDRGKQSSIKRSWRNLREALARLGLTETPTQPAHFRALQKSLLEHAEDFLRKLLERLNQRIPEDFT